MTLLAYAKGLGFELFVCGYPSKEWMEWVRTATVPLTSGQVMWREVAQDRVDQAGLRVECPPPLSGATSREEPQVAELSARPDNLGLREDPPPRPLMGRRKGPGRGCPHRDLCDQCGRCERCDYYDCSL